VGKVVEKISSGLSSSLTSSRLNELLSNTVSNTDSSNTSGSSDLISGLNLDKLNLSDDAKQKIQYAQAQFEVNYQVLKSINSSQGQETTQATFSFKASYEFLQTVSGQSSSSATSSGTSTTDSTADSTSSTSSTSSSQDSLSALKEYFSPEKTAERILDIATSFYGVSQTAQSSGDSEASRQKFADFIGSAIDEGFKQAAKTLGTLPDSIQSDVDKTHSLVNTGLQDFVKNGVDSSKTATGGVMDKIAAYRQESAQYTNQIKQAFSSGEYNAQGVFQSSSSQTWTISSLG